MAGAGIGGLAAAIAIGRAGHEVEVLERAPVPAEVGAGLAIWPNGHRALEQIGIGAIQGAPVRRLALRTWRGRLLMETPVGEFRGRYGHDLTVVHRAELHSNLLAALDSGRVKASSELAAFEQNGSTVTVTLTSGDRREADLLIGADGLRSAVRRSLLRDGEPRYSGATCWRGVARFDARDTAVNWLGIAAEFGIFPLSDARAYWFAVRNRPEREADGPGGRKADVLHAFESWPQAVADIVEATADADVLRNDLYDRPPVRSWTKGVVTLLGDAAHPMLPNAAQGACQTLEDAAALGRALLQLPAEQALRAYQVERLERANALVRQSRLTARVAQSSNPVLPAIRDLAMGHIPRSVLLGQLDRVMQA